MRKKEVGVSRFLGDIMKFTLKNVISNLIRVFNSIKVEPEDDIDKKYQRLNETLLDYLHQDKVNSKKYFSLLELEYFLLTNFIDLKEEEFDIEALRAVFDNFSEDIDSVEWYFFDSKHMLMITSEIIKNHLDSPYYDYTNLANALRTNETRNLVEELHPDIYRDIEEIKKQQELEQEGVKFLERDITSPFLFFLEVKKLMIKNKNKVLVKQYVHEKLQKLKETNEVLFKRIMQVILKFFYLYYAGIKFSYQENNNIVGMFASDLNNMLEETKSTKELIESLDDIYLYFDLLSEVPILYNTEETVKLEKTLTKRQESIYKRLDD